MVRPPIVAICGATGKQGGSVVDHLLQSRWHGHIRALTRNPEGANAMALREKGVDVVKADLTDQASMAKAFADVDTAFIMTNTFDPSVNVVDEYQQAVMAAEAAKQAGVENVIFSSLENIERATEGKYKVAPFTLKAKAADKILQMGFTNTVIVEPAFYFQNLHTLLPPKSLPDGSLAFAFPCTKDATLPFFDIRDFGGIIAKIINDPALFNLQTIPIAAEYISIARLGSELSQALGIPVTFQQVPDEVARANGILDAFIEMFHAFELVGFYGKVVNFDMAHALYPKLKTWSEYLADINLELAFEKVLRDNAVGSTRDVEPKLPGLSMPRPLSGTH